MSARNLASSQAKAAKSTLILSTYGTKWTSYHRSLYLSKKIRSKSPKNEKPKFEVFEPKTSHLGFSGFLAVFLTKIQIPVFVPLAYEDTKKMVAMSIFSLVSVLKRLHG